ncbi:hypothetical protein G2W53_004264 [Senna tora]|uniref:Uncharacterized protein n=1 Tax=Senna tora TaxID=362788 RepID=A0A835CHU2_9FABA|nr:hypothetical protein G2W53_004264 [Senna tora]
MDFLESQKEGEFISGQQVVGLLLLSVLLFSSVVGLKGGITPTLVPAPTPPQTTEPPPETNSASIPDDVSKRCNKYWKVDIIDEQGVVRDGRLKVLEVWSLSAGQQVVVPFNAEAQLVGNVAGLFSGFLGIIVTEVNTFPISYRSWDKVPNSYKEACFNSIKAKFCLDRDIDNHFVIKKLGKNWRNSRVFLFGRFYKVEKTREHNLEKYLEFIPFDMWAAFVDYRLEQKTKVVSYKLSLIIIYSDSIT